MSQNFKFGDEIYFTNEISIQSSDIKKKTFLFADIFGNIIWNIPPKKFNVPLDFDRSIWVICPKLSYVDKENKISKESEFKMNDDINDEEDNEEVDDDKDDDDKDDYDDNNDTTQFDNTIKEGMSKKKLVEQERKNMLKALEERVQIENNRNQEIMSSSNDSQISYGSIVQLMHKKSGKFLAVKHSCAKYDKTCLGLELSDGSTMCHFTVTPKYKVRSEGGLVLLNDEIALSPVDQSLSGYYIHGSPPESDDVSNSIDTSYESKSGYQFFEANLSRDFIDCGVIVSLHTRAIDNSKYIRTGEAICFWAPDAEAFIQVQDQSQDQPEAISKQASISSGINVGSRLSDYPNPKTHPSCFSSNAVWAFEKQNRREGGLIEWKNVKYRIRHIATNQYLTVTSIPFKSDQDRMKMSSEEGKDKKETKYKLALTDNDEQVESNISQLFTLNYVDKSSLYVPNEEVLVVLTHTSTKNEEFYIHVHQEGKIEKNVDGKRLQLDHHNDSTKKKSTILGFGKSKNDGFVINAKVTVLKSGASEEYKGKIFASNKDGTYDIFRRISNSDDISETQINRFVYVSNKKRIADALILVAVEPERQEIVELLASTSSVAESYLKFIKNESEAGKELSQSGKKIDFPGPVPVL